MTLLLRSLPPELTPGEQLTLSAAIPQDLHETETPGMIAATRLDAHTVRQDASTQTLLWRMTSCVVFRLFLLVQLILPYVIISFRHAAQFEHEHQLARRAFQTSCAIGSGAGRRVGQAVCRLHKGVVGEVLSHATVYCAESIAGGIQQGLADASKLRETRAHERTADTVIR
jgi:hypothetical protein